jgi:hypothetical protein
VGRHRHRCGISKVTIKDVSFEITYAVGELIKDI